MTGNPTQPKHERVLLVVDDESAIRSSMRRCLRQVADRILTAPGGQEGLDILASEPVSVIISDYKMPGMDGVAFLRRVKEGWPAIQRVMLTGAAEPQMIEDLVNRSEVFRFFTKPWSASQLRATVSECFDRVALVERNQRYENELADRNLELKQINRDLEQLVQDRSQALVQAEKMAALGRMAGGVAHEINNPLGAILAFVQLMIRDLGDDPSTRENLDAIEQCTLRCTAIVNSLLNFSRQPRLEVMEEVDLNRVAELALAIAKLDPQVSGAKIRLDLQPNLQAARGQPNLLEQVVVNLLQNALHASEYRGPVVLRTLSDDEGWVRLEVEDSGPGIPGDVLPHIFEPFFTTKEVGQGTGLGLSICYGIVEEHGGELSARSRQDKGAILTLRLPGARNGGGDLEGGNGHG